MWTVLATEIYCHFSHPKSVLDSTIQLLKYSMVNLNKREAKKSCIFHFERCIFFISGQRKAWGGADAYRGRDWGYPKEKWRAPSGYCPNTTRSSHVAGNWWKHQIQSPRGCFCSCPKAIIMGFFSLIFRWFCKAASGQLWTRDLSRWPKFSWAIF